MHLTNALDIRFVGPAGSLPAPRYRCGGAPALRVFVGPARDLQRALATTSADVPRLAIAVGGRDEPVDCADLVVRAHDAREARSLCGILLRLATPGPDTLIETEAADLADVVAAGGGGPGVILRRRAPTLVGAARRVRLAGGTGIHAMVLRMTASNRPGTLDDLNQAMALLGDDGDQITTLALGIRTPGTPTRIPTIELLACVAPDTTSES